MTGRSRWGRPPYPRPSRLQRAGRKALALAPYGLLALSFVLLAVSVWARPGGGQSFGGRSGGGSGSRGGGGDGSGDSGPPGELLLFFVELTVDHPAIGIPLLLVVFLVVVVGWTEAGYKEASWSTSSTSSAAEGGSTFTAAAEKAAVRARPSRAVRKDLLATVTRLDPDFSLVLFEDFLYALYAAAHEARGKDQLGPLAAYLQPSARQVLTDGGELHAHCQAKVTSGEFDWVLSRIEQDEAYSA